MSVSDIKCQKMARGSNKNNRRNFKTNASKKRSFPFNKKNPHGKRKSYDNDKYNDEKHRKIEENAEQNKQVSSSESEEENENPLTQLLSTFDVKSVNKRHVIIDTDESGSSESSDENLEKDELENDENNEIIESNSDDSDENEVSIEEERKDEIEDQELVEENEIDQDTLEEDGDLKVTNDPFVQHFCYDLSDNLVDEMKNIHQKVVHNVEWPCLGKLQISLPTCEEIKPEISNFTITETKTYASLGQIPTKINSKKMKFDDIHIKSQIHDHIKPANNALDEKDACFTQFQCELFSVINNYQDLYYTERTFENGEEIRFMYCLHAINHVLKTRTKVLHHNARLTKKDDVPEEFRDQGLVRPKVLIIAPFRDSALKIVQMLISLLVPQEAGQVINKKRFVEEFTGSELYMPKKNPKPEDYEINFSGNCDDTFKIGIQVTKKSLKLYSDFYSSDIIIASPLGLRLTVGAEGEFERDHDFLASIEVLIFDQTELFLMQNWDHLTHILDHLHVQPKQAHGTDFARVRTWALNGWSRYYRQTLIFSAFALPEINAIFNRRCANYAGSVRSMNPIKSGSINNVHVQVPQVFRRFEADSVLKAIDGRFEFFVNKVLPQYKDSIMKNCLIFVPSYFDYVKIRNYFKKEDIGFVQICEYSKDRKIARARDLFFHGDKHFLLYSERFHYFRRIRIKGIRHVIFYQPPIFPHFYSEICNFMHEANQNKKSGSMSNMTVTVIYSKYDSHQMAAILSTERLTKMAASTNNFHMFTSSES